MTDADKYVGLLRQIVTPDIVKKAVTDAYDVPASTQDELAERLMIVGRALCSAAPALYENMRKPSKE